MRYAAGVDTTMHLSATYEPAVCPWCGHDDPAGRYPALHVVDCRRCGLRFASPQLNGAARAALYAEAYFRSDDSHALGYDDYDADRPQLLRTFRARLRELAHQMDASGRLLDVGCATGICVHAARDLGWEAEGIDVSAYAVTVGRERYGLPLHCSDVVTWRSDLAPYDAITMWDYLEHVPDPLRTLRAVYALLRPGGRLVLTIPDVASWPARAFRERWIGYKRDEHLVYFRRAHLRAFLRAAGFTPLFEHYAGKHVRLDFACARLGAYAPRMARVLDRGLNAAGIGGAVLYVNPMDILCATAERPIGTGL